MIAAPKRILVIGCWLLVISLFIAVFIIWSFFRNPSSLRPEVLSETRGPTIVNGKVKYPHDYTILMVGDSMTEYLGNSDELRVNLTKHYPNKSFEILNYGFGSTNILSVPERLLNTTNYKREFRPISEIYLDLILIESFGNNPLSQYLSIEEGLKKQTEVLSEVIKIIREKNPEARIAFVATIAPVERYGVGVVELSDEERKRWVDERKRYIKNHIEYALNNKIPLINIYEKSLKSNGGGNEEYISETDNIHPSPKGVIFISKVLSDEIYSQKLLE